MKTNFMMNLLFLYPAEYHEIEAHKNRTQMNLIFMKKFKILFLNHEKIEKFYFSILNRRESRQSLIIE